MAPHSSTLAWKIPSTEEPGRLQSMGLLRVRHDWVTSLSLFTYMHWRRKWQPTPVLWAAVYGIAQSQTQLKRLSSSSSSSSRIRNRSRRSDGCVFTSGRSLLLYIVGKDQSKYLDLDLGSGSYQTYNHGQVT